MFVGRFFGKELYKNFLDRGREAGFIVAQPRTPKFSQNSGLLVLSRYPITKVRERDWGKLVDFATKKGILEAVLSIGPAHSLCVFTLHLSAHSADDRQSQLKELVKMVKSARRVQDGRTKWMLVAGDYNICPFTRKDEFDLMEAKLTKVGLRDIFHFLTAQHVFTWNDTQRLDYIYTDLPLHAVLDAHLEAFQTPESLRISDHHALSCVVAVPSS